MQSEHRARRATPASSGPACLRITKPITNNISGMLISILEIPAGKVLGSCGPVPRAGQVVASISSLTVLFTLHVPFEDSGLYHNPNRRSENSPARKCGKSGRSQGQVQAFATILRT